MATIIWPWDAILRQQQGDTALLSQQIAAMSAKLDTIINLANKEIEMSGSLEAQVQQAAAQINDGLDALSTEMDQVKADLTTIAQNMLPGNQITQADVDQITAAVARLGGVQSKVDDVKTTTGNLANPTP